MALDLDNRQDALGKQMTPADAYVSACRLPDKTNCPESNGPDFDFSASPILVTLSNGRRALVAGQKSAIVHAVDPDRQGEIIWQTRVGEGGTMGGVQWGSATDGTNVYVALSDIGRIALTYSQFTAADPKRGGGMFALKLDDRRTRLVHAAGRLRHAAALQPGAVGRRQRLSRASRSRGRWTATCAPTRRPTARSCGTTTPCTRSRPSTASKPGADRSTAPAPPSAAA